MNDAQRAHRRAHLELIAEQGPGVAAHVEQAARAERTRLIALLNLHRDTDDEALGQALDNVIGHLERPTPSKHRA